MAIYKYIDEKTGKTRYWLKGYVGIDPMTGKEKRVNRKGFTSEKQAELTLARLQLGLEEVKVKSLKLEDVYNDWLLSYEDDVKDSTLLKTKTLFRIHIMPFFGELYIDKIQTKHIQDWIDSKRKGLNCKPYKNYRVLHRYLSSIFDYAKGLKYVNDNPCNYTVLPKRDKKRTKRNNKIDIIWTKDELKSFLSFVEEELPFMWYVFFRLLAYTGMRRGEILALEWSDLDIKGKSLSITKSRKRIENKGTGTSKSVEVTGDTKTGNERVISLDETTLTLLKKWQLMQLKVYGRKNIIFNNTLGDYIILSTPIKRLNRIIKKHNLREIDIHRFRHIHTTMLILANPNEGSITSIMDRLGHADVETTLNIYAHIYKEQKIDVLENYIEYLG